MALVIRTHDDTGSASGVKYASGAQYLQHELEDLARLKEEEMATILSSTDLKKGHGIRPATAVKSSFNADLLGLAKAAFVTSSGTVSYRSGWVIAYPEVVAWARLQALYYRGHGIAAGPDFPYALDCTETYASIKHQNSVQTLLACLLMCSPQDLTSFAASLFDFLEQTDITGWNGIDISVDAERCWTLWKRALRPRRANLATTAVYLRL